jgi:uncharacterized DUF497 family protein
MRIEFDPAKDVLNIKNHGLSLAVAAELEWDLLISHEDDTLHDSRAAHGGLCAHG